MLNYMIVLLEYIDQDLQIYLMAVLNCRRSAHGEPSTSINDEIVDEWL